MDFKLLPYQEALVTEFALHAGRVLFHVDVGLGKTRTALACGYTVKAHKILFITLASTKFQIIEEAIKCGYPITSTAVIDGTPSERRQQWEDAQFAEVISVSYETFHKDIEYIIKLNPELVVIDECQRIANPRNEIHKSLKKINPKYRIAMSATPAKNGLYEFYPTLAWVNPLVYDRNFYIWRQRNCRMHPAIPGKIIGYFDENGVRKDFSKYTIRLKRDGVINLPPLSHITHYVDITAEERERYNKIKNELLVEMPHGEDIPVPNLLALILRLRQVVDAPQIFGSTKPSSKQKAFGELLETCLSGGFNKVIVFVVHKTVATELRNLYGGVIYDGSLSSEERQEVLAEFKSSESSVMYMTSAGQAGINLTESSCVIHYQLPYTYADVEQREGRIWRMGQKRGCVSYKVLARGTMDQRINSIVSRKTSITRDELIKALSE